MYNHTILEQLQNYLSIFPRVGYPMIRSVFFLLVLLCTVSGFAQGPGDPEYRWFGHDFAFCFITDDGRLPNEEWANLARAMDFRFTIAINTLRSHTELSGVLSFDQLEVLNADGFEIAQHGYSHGFNGLPETCSSPYRGSLMGYFLCGDVDPTEAMTSLQAEIERDSIAFIDGVSANDVRTVAYPRHRHGKALIDSLISEGYIAARTGGLNDYDMNSFGDFDFPSKNGWDEGISLFRMNTGAQDLALFGDHSGNPSVHYTYEQFTAIAQARINHHKTKGGIFVLFTHHLGNDDDSYGDINYDGGGGVTAQDLAWMVDLVRSNNGVVMTFSEAATYFRSRSSMSTIDGDYVWVPDTTDIENPRLPISIELSAYPNPFNPQTSIKTSLLQSGPMSLNIYDASGAHVATLANEHREAGHHTWSWNGRDDMGKFVGAGVYFANLRSFNDQATCRLLLLK
jgi:hypothetical protein